MSSTFPVNYCDLSDLIQLLGLTRDDCTPAKYLIWQIPVEQDVLDYQVKRANEWTTNLFGDLSKSPQPYAIAIQYASTWAALHLLQTMAIQWQVSGLPVTVGGLTIARLPALTAAMAELEKRFTADLQKYYINLCQISFVDSGSQMPHSPYLDTHGQSSWP